MIGLAPVECLLYALAQFDIVNEVQNVDGPQNVVQLPQGLFGVVLPGVAAEFAYHGGLGRVFLRKGCQDTLDIGPFADDQLFVGPIGWPNQHVGRILTWQLEPDQGRGFLLHGLIARGKAVAAGI